MEMRWKQCEGPWLPVGAILIGYSQHGQSSFAVLEYRESKDDEWKPTPIVSEKPK